MTGVSKYNIEVLVRTGDMLKEVKAIVVMLVLQFIFAGMYILFKLTVDDGTNLKVLVAYRLSFATISMLPLALIFQRFPFVIFLSNCYFPLCLSFNHMQSYLRETGFKHISGQVKKTITYWNDLVGIQHPTYSLH